MPFIVEFDIGDILGQFTQGDCSADDTVKDTLGIYQGSHEPNADIGAGDRAKGRCTHNHFRIFSGHRIPGTGPGIITRGLSAWVGAHKASIFAPHVHRMNVGVSDAVPVKYRDDAFFELSVVILKGLFVGIQEGGKILIVAGAYEFILGDAI